MHKNVDIVLIALSTPIYIGIYENNKLIKTIESDKKSSDILPILYRDILEEYSVQNFFYANGPGSFMAIKVAYIFLKSLSIIKNIPLYATDAFNFNNNQPIKALGKLCFIKDEDGEIKSIKVEEVPALNFELPIKLDNSIYHKNTLPLYKIGAVG